MQENSFEKNEPAKVHYLLSGTFAEGPNQREDAAEDSPGDLPCPEKLDSPTGSPPTASSSSLMELENCVSNLNLAHELVLNRDFCFKPSLPTDRREKHSFTLQSVLLPRHVSLMMSQLDEVLDMELIWQEVDHGALRRLTGYIINTMETVCAPERRPEVRALRDLRDRERS
ncbi:T-complex protein 11-like protein 1 [Dissostichus eleginoides]|uniref:T-complex protein 11-like protein 1 n=1 Tax=Dissostichus eleginoides TaxID=100907 RepID=A0AAD9FJE1_DISEL|nr:T-complex protein 11-like protein 1 [Dissostichus eleginoides]